MATHHHPSPSGALHAPPIPQIQPNGHHPSQSMQRAPTSTEYHLTKLLEAIWMQIGRTAELMDHKPIAIEAYQRTLYYNKENVDALRSVASVLRADDKYEEAVEYIKALLVINPNDGEAHSSLGHCYLMMDELQLAYGSYQAALYNLQDPKEPKLWYGIGILYDRYGSLDHAEEAFSQVMRMAPEFDKANEIYFRLGIIYKQQGKYAQSLECFQYIVNRPPHPLNQTDIWFQVGHVYEQQKDYESAKSAYMRVLERDPQHAKVLQQLGWLYHQQSSDYQSQEQAIAYLENSVKSDGSDAQSWYLLGRCYMSQHKFPKAYEAYQQAVYRDGRNPTFWCSIGVLYYQINQYRDALDAYSRAIRLNPNISEVWYDLGTLYESCNNQTNDALDAYQRAAELDPTNQHIKARLQLLRSGGTSGPNQAAAPLPQDVPPQHYQPTAASGPPQPQWGAPAPSHTPHPQGPPPAPLNAPREWGGHRVPDLHSSQSQPPPPAPLNPYDQRDIGRNHLPARQPTPTQDRMRPPPDSARPTPMSRPLSPSPRARNAVPSQYRTPQMPPQGPAPLMHQQQQGPPPPPPQSNRIANPNYNPQPPPPAPNNMPAPMGHGQLAPYGRMTSPANEIRPIHDQRPPSPRGGYVYQQPSHHHQHHPEPAGHGAMQGGGPPPPPPPVMAVAEAAAREREREQREREREREQREREREQREREHRDREHRDREREQREQREREDRDRELREREMRERDREFREREQREQQRERERERERDSRPPSSAPSKRYREWEHPEDSAGSHYKKSATEESRARLDDPNAHRRGPTSPVSLPPMDRDRADRDRIPLAGPPSRPASALAPQMPSPGAARRAEDARRANENYRPSEVAHHPAPLSTVLHQEQLAQQQQPPQQAPQQGPPQQSQSSQQTQPSGPQPPPHHQSIPSMQHNVDRQGPEQHRLPPINIAPKREVDNEPMKMDIDDEPPQRKRPEPPPQSQSQQSQAQPGPPPPPPLQQQPVRRPEEPAARKVEVDENYDEESAEEGKAVPVGKPQQGGVSQSSRPTSRGSPRGAQQAGGMQSGMTNGSVRVEG